MTTSPDGRRGRQPVPARYGRLGTVHSDVPDWLVLAGLSPTAVYLYLILNAHVNQLRGDRLAWPTMDTLAQMVGFSRADKLKRYIDELVGVGAVEVSREGMPARNVYLINKTPPEGYSGAETVADWYAKRQNPQVIEEPPHGGGLAEPPQDPPAEGTQEHPARAAQEPPARGGKQTRTNKQEENKGSDQPSVDRRRVNGNSLPPEPPTPPAASVQPRLDGGIDPPPEARKPVLRNLAMKISRDWINWRISEGEPVVFGKSEDPAAAALPAVASLVLPFVVAGCTEAEIKFALQKTETTLPTTSALERAITAVRGGWRPGRRSGGGGLRGRGGSMTGINVHVDDMSAEERAADNPFRQAIQASPEDVAADEADMRERERVRAEGRAAAAARFEPVRGVA